jgi:NAD(P)H dehydrogenase (quinone)
MLPLLHQGMLFTGVPYSETALTTTTTGGTPYGSSHVESDALSTEEVQICRSQGARLAMLAKKLSTSK